MMQNCFDYYAFTEDTDYLRSDIYPMMKENAVFGFKILFTVKSRTDMFRLRLILLSTGP